LCFSFLYKKIIYIYIYINFNSLLNRIVWLEETYIRIYTSISKANISNGNEAKLEMWRALCDMHIQQDIAIEISNCPWWRSFSFSFFSFIVINVMMTKKCRWRWLKNKKQAGYEQFIDIGHLLLLPSSSDVIRLQIASSMNDIIVIFNVHIAVMFLWIIHKQACY
jgi:hypothetical protein